jgi:hypothetical protein
MPGLITVAENPPFNEKRRRPDGPRGYFDPCPCADLVPAARFGFLSFNVMFLSIGLEADMNCSACRTGKYPTLTTNSKTE